MEAGAHAKMGRVAAFQCVTETAHELQTAAKQNQEPYWTACFDEAELAGVTGGRLLDLARRDPVAYADKASVEKAKSVALRGPEISRGTALDRIGLAESRFLIGDTISAVEHTYEAIHIIQ